MSSFSKWDRDAYWARVGEEESARRRSAIMAEQWGHQLAEQRRRLGFTQAGLAEIIGVTPGRVSQIEHGKVSPVEALAMYVTALGGKLEFSADIGLQVEYAAQAAVDLGHEGGRQGADRLTEIAVADRDEGGHVEHRVFGKAAGDGGPEHVPTPQGLPGPHQARPRIPGNL